MSLYFDIKRAYENKQTLPEIHAIFHQIEDKNETDSLEYGKSFVHLAAMWEFE